MNGPGVPPGRTQDFVLGQGFREVFGALRLVDSEGYSRGFLELTSDPDHPQTRPEEGFERLLAALKPGGTVRLLQIRWPEPGPRLAFYENAAGWQFNAPVGVAVGMQDELLRFLRQTPLPYRSRTILEAVLRAAEDVEWFEAAVDLLEQHGIFAKALSPAEVQELAHFMFHPELG